MSWSIGYDEDRDRDVGYGVPAECDHPDCNERIDRGLSFVCGSEPFGGTAGCGLFFCERHRQGWMEDADGQLRCVCDRCASGKQPFAPKPDVAEWLHHKMTDPSWAEWRQAKNGEECL